MCFTILSLRPHKQSLWFLVSARVASDPRVGIFNFLFFFLAMKRCPIAAKIAGSYWNSWVLCFNTNSQDNKGSWGILKDFYCSVTMLRELGLNDFFPHRGMNVCLICEASLSLNSQHTLYLWEIWHTMYHVFPPGDKKKDGLKKKSAPPHRFWRRPITRNRSRFCFDLKGQFRHDQSRLSTGHWIVVLDEPMWLKVIPHDRAAHCLFVSRRGMVFFYEWRRPSFRAV